jgi:DNA-binding GntR family transcriptional regulator
VTLEVERKRPLRKSRKLAVDMVRDALREPIASGSFAAGDRLPSEVELAQRYGVSRLTLREAVRGLVEEGYLSRRQGDGTFVTQRPRLRNNLDVNFGVTHLVESMGMRPGSKLIDLRREPADEQVAAALAIRAGAPTVRLERVRTANGAPLVYSIEHIAGWILPESFSLDSLRGSLYAALEAAGIEIHHGVAQVAAVSATRAQARHLAVRAGSPLLLLTQVDYAAADQACIYAREWYLSSLVDVRVYRRGTKLRPSGYSTIV